MVKNRAEKRNARAIKAKSGLTYPRAQARLRAGQGFQFPSLFIGYGPDGESISHRPARGSALIISGNAGSGQSVLMRRLAAEASAGADVHLIDVGKDATDYLDIREGFASVATTDDSAIGLLRHLAKASAQTPAVLFVDYITYAASSIEGFQDAIKAVSEAGVPVIVAGQRAQTALPEGMLDRADRILVGKSNSHQRMSFFRFTKAASIEGFRFHGVLETHDGTVAHLDLPLSSTDRPAPTPLAESPGYRFEFGTDALGSPVAFTPARDLHLLVAGCPGAGKTWFLRALATDAVKSMDVYVSSTSPHKESELRVPWAAMTATSLEATADMLQEIMREMNVRNARCHRESVRLSADLRDAPRPILIILDEFHALTANDPNATAAECTPEDRHQRARIAAAVGKIAREGRAAGVSMVLSTQRPIHPQEIPGGITSLSRLVLGRLDGGFQNLTDELIDPALQALRPATRQGIYAPLSGDGGLVDIVLP